MIDVNMQLYRDYTFKDFYDWKRLYKMTNVPDNVAMELYAHSLNHQGLSTKWQNKFFTDIDTIVQYDDYYRRLGMQTQKA